MSALAAELRQKYASVHPVSQVVLTIDSEDTDLTLDRARSEILRWIAKRAGRPLPTTAWEGEAFDLDDVGAQRASAVSLDSPPFWAARLDDADKVVPQRTWATEVALGVSSAAEVLFGCRLQCVTRGDYQPIVRSIPGIVRQVIESVGGRIDGRASLAKPWRVTSDSDVEELTRFLLDPARRLPVLVASEGDKERVRDLVVSADALSSKTLGAAHVVVLSAHASYGLTDCVGKEFSVFHGAVRTYNPGFHPEQDEPADHPLALRARIENWAGGGPGAFLEFLVSQVLRNSVRGPTLEQDLPSFSTVKELALRRRRGRAQHAGASEKELFEMALEEVEGLTRKLGEQRETYVGLLNTAEGERDEAIAEAKDAKAEVNRLRARIDHLAQALQEKGHEEEIRIPDSLEELDIWASQFLAGSVVILNRAIRAAKKSKFSDPGLVYRALLLFRDYYAPMRRNGGLNLRNDYHRSLQELGLEDAPSFGGARAAEEGDSYFVRFGGRRCELDRHLKGSNARDERFGFRVYFFWDEDSEQVVVGWLPSHLPTRAS